MTKRVLFVVVDYEQEMVGSGVKMGRHNALAGQSAIVAFWTLGALQKADGGKLG